MDRRLYDHVADLQHRNRQEHINDRELQVSAPACAEAIRFRAAGRLLVPSEAGLPPGSPRQRRVRRACELYLAQRGRTVLKRRDLLKSAAGATALPVFGQHDHPQSAPGSQRAAAAWKAKLFDEHQLETVAVLADLIIPATD